MQEIQSELRRKGKKNVQEGGIKERYFIIVDEVGELNPTEAVTKEEKLLKQQCQTIMSQIFKIRCWAWIPSNSCDTVSNR